MPSAQTSKEPAAMKAKQIAKPAPPATPKKAPAAANKASNTLLPGPKSQDPLTKTDLPLKSTPAATPVKVHAPAPKVSATSSSISKARKDLLALPNLAGGSRPSTPSPWRNPDLIPCFVPSVPASAAPSRSASPRPDWYPQYHYQAPTQYGSQPSGQLEWIPPPAGYFNQGLTQPPAAPAGPTIVYLSMPHLKDPNLSDKEKEFVTNFTGSVDDLLDGRPNERALFAAVFQKRWLEENNFGLPKGMKAIGKWRT